MFNKHVYVIGADNGHDERARELSKLNLTLSENSKAEIKARDRVDISLEEYQRLISENSRLERERTRFLVALNNLGISVEVARRIIPDTIVVSVSHDHKDFKDRYRIEFDTEYWRDI